MAQGEEISAAPQQEGGDVKYLDLPVSPGQGKQEQRGGSPQPEQQVQGEGQPAFGKLPAQRPEHIVHQAQRPARQYRLPKGRRLSQSVYAHGLQRSSRAKKPPRPPVWSSS